LRAANADRRRQPKYDGSVIMVGRALVLVVVVVALLAAMYFSAQWVVP